MIVMMRIWWGASDDQSPFPPILPPLIMRDRPALPLKIDIIFADPQWAASRVGGRALIKNAITTAWGMIPKRPKNLQMELCVTLTNDAEIRTLNHAHRNQDKATNVLSFPDWDHYAHIPAMGEHVPIGDIFMSFETIRDEARAQGKKLGHHLTHLTIHGFLHLLGYDHITDRDADIMETLEIKILKKLGIQNPYFEKL